MTRPTRNWPWIIFNLSAASIWLYTVTQGDTEFSLSKPFDMVLESAKWAVRFLLFCLLMTPLKTYFGWNRALTLRKSAGLWAFVFAASHVGYYIISGELVWRLNDLQLYIVLGLLGILILGCMAVTSNRWAMQRLGKSWKRLHRLVYGASIAVTLHALLVWDHSKRVYFRDPDAQGYTEQLLYLGVLCVLLLVRLPWVRRQLTRRSVSGKKAGAGV